MGQYFRDKENVESREEFRVGDLVVYKYPRKFFTVEEDGKNVVGVITRFDYIHAKVFWGDGIWCLESLEDLSMV